MALPFRRSGGVGDAAGPLVASAPSPERRRWEVAVLLCSLSPEVREALEGWLLAPPARFARRRGPIGGQEAEGQTCEGGVKLLRAELRAIRQTLDFPPEALSGLTRNGLLTAHGIRLRQLEGWLWPPAAQVIRRMIA